VHIGQLQHGPGAKRQKPVQLIARQGLIRRFELNSHNGAALKIHSRIATDTGFPVLGSRDRDANQERDKQQHRRTHAP